VQQAVVVLAHICEPKNILPTFIFVAPFTTLSMMPSLVPDSYSTESNPEVVVTMPCVGKPVLYCFSETQQEETAELFGAI
jgi:hypothetical protein